MAELSRKLLQEEIIVGSEKILFHPMIAYHRGITNPIILKNSEFISYINTLVPKFIACKDCHLLFDYGSWSRRKFLMHLESIHHIVTGENVNFIFPLVLPKKKQIPEPISIPESISIPEPISTPEPISIPQPSSIPETSSILQPISILETALIATDESPLPGTQQIEIEPPPQVPEVNIADTPLKKKRGRKPKLGVSEKQEKTQKPHKAKKA